MDDVDDLAAIINDRHRKLLLASIIIVCIIVTVYVNLIMRVSYVYTHLFYIPIILAGIWYHKKAILVALFLGLAHIAIGFYQTGYLGPDTFIRASSFLIVAIVVGYLSEDKDKLYNSQRLLLESTDEGIFGVDPEGKCTFINGSALRMLGYTRAEVRGNSPHDLIHHTKLDGTPCRREDCYVIRSLKEGTGYRDSDDIFWRKDGAFFPVEYSSYPIIVDGRVKGAVVTFIDISERNKAEKDIREARKQAEFYVDLMGHDINNMNQVGISFLELGLDMLKLSDADKVYLQKPLEALSNSSLLIDNVRKLQMVREGGVMHERLDMCKALNEVVMQYSHVPGRDVTINYDPPPECPVLAGEILKDVFSNIVGNAIKHSVGPITINIDVGSVFEDGRDHYRVDISDTGPGIPDELKEKLFTRHQRGDTRATGRGLGLYLVKKLVEDFQGKVWVENRVTGDHSKGTRFVVMLPAITS